jgi:hypothetical protein
MQGVTTTTSFLTAFLRTSCSIYKGQQQQQQQQQEQQHS